MTDADGRPIVAELGRAETPEETWARKDAARTARRQHQTAFNLVIALIASLGIVLFLVAVVVRPDTQIVDRTVDYQQVAADANVRGVELAAPTLPKGFSANRADWTDKSGDGVDVWTVGFLTPDKQYIGLQQGVSANASWVANQLDQKPATGAVASAAKPAAGAKVAAKVTPKPVPRVEEPEDDTDQIATGSVE